VAGDGAASDEHLLRALEGGRWCSGADLASALGVSRAAIWKRIARLRTSGYEIEAQAGLGYRIVSAPDRLLPHEVSRHVEPGALRFEIVHRDEIDSTNLLASELARKGAAEGTAVVAESQTAGRGRLGRSWISPAGRNLYLSLVLRPGLPPAAVPQITLMAAVSVARALDDLGAVSAGIKWPNDLQLDGRKVAGILTELEAESERVHFVVLGIGVNLNMARGDFPRELRDVATSLRIATGEVVDRRRFTGRLLTHLARDYEVFLAGGFAALRSEYQRRHVLAGRRVSVGGAVAVSGVVRGVAPDGALLLETTRGTERVLAGEVTLRGKQA
jgi:BirA family transcriptional regulator, biotin operon repressor / biotin---[acetyl-CoA-carboxylase] ligase